MRFKILVFLGFAAVSACGDDGAPDGPPIEYGCLEPAHVYIFNEDELASACADADGVECARPGLAFPKGRETRVQIRVFDDDGRLCDPAMTTVAFGTEDFIAVADGNDFIVSSHRDVFDAGNLLEPSATMDVGYGALRRGWQAMGVVDLAGTWEITVDGLVVGDFEAAQSGRMLRWAQCDAGDTRPECSAGEVRLELVRLQSPIGMLELEGSIDPSRTSIEGYWTSDPSHNGQWSAVKLPE